MLAGDVRNGQNELIWRLATCIQSCSVLNFKWKRGIICTFRPPGAATRYPSEARHGPRHFWWISEQSDAPSLTLFAPKNDPTFDTDNCKAELSKAWLPSFSSNFYCRDEKSRLFVVEYFFLAQIFRRSKEFFNRSCNSRGTHHFIHWYCELARIPLKRKWMLMSPRMLRSPCANCAPKMIAQHFLHFLSLCENCAPKNDCSTFSSLSKLVRKLRSKNDCSTFSSFSELVHKLRSKNDWSTFPSVSELVRKLRSKKWLLLNCWIF